jgi:chromosomal replication initiator protein
MRRSDTQDWSSPPGAQQPLIAQRLAGAETLQKPVLSLSDRLIRIVGQASFDRHFAGRVELRPASGKVEVHVASRAAADVIRRRFGVALRQVGTDASVDGQCPEVEFVVAADLAVVAPSKHPGSAPSIAVRAESATLPAHQSPRSSPVSRYRLEDYLIGDSNRMAFNAASHLAEGDDPGASRTLFIHGPCGLGKTHLLQGVAQRFRERLPGAVVRMTSGEAFMNDFVAAIRAAGSEGSKGPGGVASFRRAYRRADLLCIDDVHFLAAKQATQDELLHTFDEIERGGARVLLVSDQHPRALRKFSPALVSRFMSGMVASIAPPEAALRERIVRSFSIRRGLALDDSGVRAVASRAAWLPGASAGPSIRDIEGMLTKIDALRRVAPEYVGADGRIGAAGVERAFGSAAAAGSPGGSSGGTVAQSPRPARPVRMHIIIAQTCAAIGVESADLAGKTRHKRVVLARELIIYIARALTTQSFPDIARALGRPSHSTVITAYQRFCKQLESDEAVTLEHAAEPTTLSVLTRQLVEAVVHASAKA